MSSSNSQSSTFSNYSDKNPCEIEDERVETDFEASHGEQMYDDSVREAYIEEPIADEAWLEEYYQRREEDTEKMRELEQRFEGNKSLTSWFLRVVAYRQFTRMVHGKLKDRRIPLPACAYTAIRLTHNGKNDEELKGYEDLESDDESL